MLKNYYLLMCDLCAIHSHAEQTEMRSRHCAVTAIFFALVAS